MLKNGQVMLNTQNCLLFQAIVCWHSYFVESSVESARCPYCLVIVAQAVQAMHGYILLKISAIKL